MKKPDNPPAFPHSPYEHEGMTLRDFFASQIIMGFAAGRNSDSSPTIWPEKAYEMADAMLAEREKQ